MRESLFFVFLTHEIFIINIYKILAFLWIIYYNIYNRLIIYYIRCKGVEEMEISTQTSPFNAFGDNKAIVKLLKDSGFTAYDFSMYSHKNNEHAMIDFDDYKEKARVLREYADSIGIKCNQTHAPFPSAKKGDEEYNKYIFPFLLRSIEVSGILGATNCVIHPCNDYTAEENAVLYEALRECAEKSGVIICTENMFNWDRENNRPCFAACATAEDFVAHVELLDKKVFGACLDLGHAEIMGDTVSAAELIHALGDRLVALHIHENDKRGDNHVLPYSFRKETYEGILKALKEIGYKGDITFESGNFIHRLPVELYPAGARFMAEMGAYFKKALSE